MLARRSHGRPEQRAGPGGGVGEVSGDGDFAPV